MVVAMLLAGGVGQRMGAKVPKQFLEVNNKPIIYYPLEILEKHPQIDAVEIVCVESFIDNMWEIVKSHGFEKVQWITAGGETCQKSIKRGIDNLKDKMDRDDILMIHMSSYPLASAEIMSDCIKVAQENGNGFAARPIVYSSFFTEDRKTSTKQIDRDRLMLCTIPYAVHFGECSDLYDRAFTEGKGVDGNVFTNTLYCDYGKRIYFSKDSETNIKVTNPEDVKIMEAFLSILPQE